MIKIDTSLLRKIIYVVEGEANFHQMKSLIAFNLLEDYSHQLIDGFPQRLIIKTDSEEDEIIILSSLIQQNLLLDSLYSHFYMIQDDDMCEALIEVRNMVNSLN